MQKRNISVELPSSLKTGGSEFASRQHTDKWLNSLPAAATGEATRQIYTALQELSEHALSPTARFYFLERTTPLFIGLLRGLELNVYRGGFPLSEKSSKTAELLLLLMALKVVNYRLVLEDLHRSLIAGGVKRGRIKRHATLRIMELLGEMFELYRHIDSPPAAELWRTYHRYYALAESEGLAGKKLIAIDSNYETTIATEFKLQQLLDVLNPHDFRLNEYHCVKTAIRHFASAVKVSPEGDINNSDCFCLQLDEDAPLSFAESERTPQHEDSPLRRCMDISVLRGKLQLFLNEQYDTLNLINCRLNRHSARIMLAGWQLHQDPHRVREQATETTRLVVGLSSIAQMLTAEMPIGTPTSAGESTEDTDHQPLAMRPAEGGSGANDEPGPLSERTGERTATDEAPPSLSEQEASNRSAPAKARPLPTGEFSANVEGGDLEMRRLKAEDEADAWGETSINITGSPGNWVEAYRRDIQPDMLTGKLVDRSPNGYGVVTEKNPITKRLQIGDLLAIEVEGSWQLVSVRWIRNEDEQHMRMGMRLIGEPVRAHALVVNRRGQASDPMPMVQLLHQSGVAAVILHNINIHARDHINFASNENEGNVQLGELLDSSSAFECYQLTRSNAHLSGQTTGEEQ